MRELKILISLGKKGALEKEITIKTTDLSKELKMPQQAVSRVLIKLIKKGLIKRVEGIRGYLVIITPKGKALLQDLDLTLDEIFKSKEIIMKGKVVDGLKDGKYYLSLSEYKKAIKKKLGFEPYPGTLNLLLINDSEKKMKERLRRMNGIKVEGFRKGGKIFGSIKCFNCRINGIKANVIIPERSHYGSNIIEIISPFQLRNKMKLKDGDEVVVRIGHENL
jgi:riboflavin kinase